MSDKPTTAAGYRPEFLERVRATCLYVATKLGDLMDDTARRSAPPQPSPVPSTLLGAGKGEGVGWRAWPGTQPALGLRSGLRPR